jgi:hypothetical protein
MDIRPATLEEEVAFFGRRDEAVRDLMAGVENGKVIAMAGLCRDPRYYGSIFEDAGRWIGFLQLAPDTPPLGFQPVLAMRHYLRGQSEDIIVQCDDRMPKAEKLLTVLGFKPTDQCTQFSGHKLRIWLYRNRPQ